jgi:hypothetical protein
MTPLVWINFGHNVFFLLKLNYRNIAFHESLSCSIDTTETVHFHCMEKSTKGRASCVCKSKKLKNNAGRNCHVKSNKSVGPSSQKISHALKVHRVLTLYFFLQLNYKASWITFFWQLNNKSHTTTRKITSANNSQQCSFCDTCAFWQEPSWPSIWVSQNPSFRNRLDTWHIEQILHQQYISMHEQCLFNFIEVVHQEMYVVHESCISAINLCYIQIGTLLQNVGPFHYSSKLVNSLHTH